MELREVVWLSSGEPPAPLQAPLVQELRKRPAEALRKAALYAGLSPDAQIKLQPLELDPLMPEPINISEDMAGYHVSQNIHNLTSYSKS